MNIAGATGSTLDLSVAGNGDKGNTIRVLVSANDGQGGQTSTVTSGSVTVANAAPVLNMTGATASGAYSDPITPFTFSATDPDGDAVTLSQGSPALPSGLTLTSTAGNGTVSGRLLAGAGTYSPQLRASDGAATTTGNAAITVTPESATLGITSPLIVSTTSSTAFSVTLGAQVTQEADGNAGDLSLARVDLLLYSGLTATGNPTRSCTNQAANASGAVSCSVLFVPTGDYTLVARMSGSGSYTAPNSDPANVTIYQTGTRRTTNATGTVTDPSFRNLPVPVLGSNLVGSVSVGAVTYAVDVADGAAGHLETYRSRAPTATRTRSPAPIGRTAGCVLDRARLVQRPRQRDGRERLEPAGPGARAHQRALPRRRLRRNAGPGSRSRSTRPPGRSTTRSARRRRR